LANYLSHLFHPKAGIQYYIKKESNVDSVFVFM